MQPQVCAAQLKSARLRGFFSALLREKRLPPKLSKSCINSVAIAVKNYILQRSFKKVVKSKLIFVEI